jgi:hypothetical protein
MKHINLYFLFLHFSIKMDITIRFYGYWFTIIQPNKYRKQPCVISRNLPLKGIFEWEGGWLYIYIMIGWETFFQDVGCDLTDISEDIDSEIQVHIQSIVPILEQFHCCTCISVIEHFLFCSFIFILITYIYINTKTGGQPYKQYFEVKPKYTPIFSSPGQRQCELLPSLGFLCRSYIISFHLYILSSEITEPN